MTAPVIRPTAQGESQLANRWAFQVDVTTGGLPDWLTVMGMSQFQYTLDYSDQDNSDFDSNGWKSTKQTQRGWGVNGGVQRKLYLASEDPGQRSLRRAALRGRDIHVRWFDRYYGEEAFEGYASVKWEPQGGGVTDLDNVNFTLSGQGKIKEIANPLRTIPTIQSATPNGTAAKTGVEVTILGSGFFGLTGAGAVKFGTVNATRYDVDDYGTEITAIIPSGTAGPAPIVVTNSIGASDQFTFTRGANS